MRIEVIGESVLLTDQQYRREVQEAFNECEKIEPERLYTQLVILEDTENELMDGYDSGWTRCAADSYSNWADYLVEIWRTQIRINHIQSRIKLAEFNFLDTANKENAYQDPGYDGDSDSGMSDVSSGPDFGYSNPLASLTNQLSNVNITSY